MCLVTAQQAVDFGTRRSAGMLYGWEVTEGHTVVLKVGSFV